MVATAASCAWPASRSPTATATATATAISRAYPAAGEGDGSEGGSWWGSVRPWNRDPVLGPCGDHHIQRPLPHATRYAHIFRRISRVLRAAPSRRRFFRSPLAGTVLRIRPQTEVFLWIRTLIDLDLRTLPAPRTPRSSGHLKICDAMGKYNFFFPSASLGQLTPSSPETFFVSRNVIVLIGRPEKKIIFSHRIANF